MRLRRLALPLLLLSAAPARGGEMEVVPVLVNLSRDEKSAVVTVRNRSPEPARYQISLLAWEQGADGDMKLSPTEAVAVFPRTLSLAPNEAKIVRVGVTGGFGPHEKGYRLFIEEMPPPPKPDAPSRVQVLSRVGIPVFVAPNGPVIEKAVVLFEGVEGAKVSFTLRNGGTVHVRPSAVKALLVDAGGKPLHERSLEAWYVLADGERRYAFEAPAERCADVRAVVVEVTIGKDVVRGRADAPRGACAP